MTLNHYPRIYTTQDISRLLTMAWLLYRGNEEAQHIIENIAAVFDATLQFTEIGGEVAYKAPRETWKRA